MARTERLGTVPPPFAAGSRPEPEEDAGTAPPDAAASPASPWSMGARFDGLAQIGIMLLLAVGCWRVLAPFFPAVLFAGVIASSTWPLYARLRGAMGGRSGWASLIACLLVVIAALSPVVLLLGALADGAAWTLRLLENAMANGLPPVPVWLERLPLLGAPIAQGWSELTADPQRLKALLSYASAPARQAALVSGRVVSNAALQMMMTTLLLYFLYRHGREVAHSLRVAAHRIGGRFALKLLRSARASVDGVVFGVLGAGLAQGTVAALGMALASVPNPLLLGALTFVLSMVPIGPPLVWAGAAAWLFDGGRAGWGVFMLVYGMFVISSIDNVLKPLLISRANHLPFVLTLMGVIGGVLGLGITGVFLGPTLIAVCVDLGKHWLQRRPAPGFRAPP